MFQSKATNTHIRFSRDFANARAGELRPISWADLVAQFDAARVFKAVAGARTDATVASFDPRSARRIAAICNGKQGINPEDLANRKAPVPISRSANERLRERRPGK